jgi:hypothetical protein
LNKAHIAAMIAGLALVVGTACGVVEVTSVSSNTTAHKAPPTRTLEPTFTSTPDWTATPTPTDTATPTPTPTVTDTPTNTSTPEPPTDTPTATRTPRPAVPTATPTPVAPTDTPTPAVDFVVTKQDVMKIIENGSCNWRQNIYVTVVDKGGTPLDGLVVGDKWNNIELNTGDKGPGKCTFDLWKNSLELLVKREQSGKPYRSEITRRLSSDQPTIDDMIKGGVCKDEAECHAKIASNSYCIGHYAYEVTFQRTW